MTTTSETVDATPLSAAATEVEQSAVAALKQRPKFAARRILPLVIQNLQFRHTTRVRHWMLVKSDNLDTDGEMPELGREGTGPMQRTTISINEGLGAAFDEMVESRGYSSRSEAVRDLVRQAVEDWRNQRGGGEPCVANFSFVYDQNVRSLANRLAEWRHAHHDLIIAATLVPLDHHDTLESLMLKGEAGAVTALADGIRAERGVRFGTLNLIGVEADDVHSGEHHHSHSGRQHLSPRPG